MKNKCLMRDEDKTLIMMINDVHRLFNHKACDIVDLIGISPAVNSILFHLSKNESLTQVDLVNKSHLRPSSVSVTLQKMEHDGLIVRESNLEDQRYITVRMTEKGKEIEEKVRKSIRSFDEDITSDITNEEKEITKKVIKKIIGKLMEDR